VDTKALFTDSAALPEPATVAQGRIFLQGSYLYQDGAADISTGKEFAQTTFAALTVIFFGTELFGWNETPRTEE